MSGPSPARLTVEGLCKSFSGVPVLKNVALTARAGEIVSLIGENGSGKSTTLNILAGLLKADVGSMRLDGEPYHPADRRASELAGVAFIQQELNIFPNLSVAENLFLGGLPAVGRLWPFVSRRKMRDRAQEVLHAVGLRVDPDAAARKLSPGERQLLEIGRGVSVNARLMILDEPTTSLSPPETHQLFTLLLRLRARAMAILFISHALDDVLQLSDRILVLRDGEITLNAGRGEVGANQLVKAMVGRPIETLFPRRQPGTRPGKPVLQLRGVSEPGIVADINLTVSAGEIVGVAGLMGSGRTALARIIFGLDSHREGSVLAHEREVPSAAVSAAIAAGMAFLTEDRRQEGLLRDASVSDNMAIAAQPLFSGGWLRITRARSLAVATRALAERLRIKSGGLERTRIEALSGGNQQKALLGRWLLRRPRIFLLDEPTRGIDIGAKQEIYRILAGLADEGVGMLVISSELEELIGLCDRILVMRRGRLTGEFERAQFSREGILAAAFGRECVA